jgi:hypothetical protein
MKMWVERQQWKGLGLALALLGTLLGGCGGGDKDQARVVPAAGKATYKGGPIKKGTIVFVPEKEGRGANGTVEDGSFTMSTYGEGDGAIPGKYKVGVIVTEEVPTKGGDTTTKYLIPQKFSDAEQSGLTIEVPAGGSSSLQVDVK